MKLFGKGSSGSSTGHSFETQSPVLSGLSGRRHRVGSEGVDLVVFLITATFLCVGSLMVYSASISLADSPKYNTTQYHFLMRHLVSICVALFTAYCVYRIPMRFWRRTSSFWVVLGILLLVAVIIPGIGHAVNGSRRWIGVGSFSLQVTEYMKFAVLIGAAAFTVQRQEFMHSFSRGFFPMGTVMAVICALISMQPDLGAIIVVCGITLGVLFLGGLNLRIFVSVALVAVFVVSMMIYDSPWRVGRVMAYLDPWSAEYSLDKAYQLSHSLIAFGRGEFFGVGLGASVEKLHYLPEAHTDFILAIVGEELGFVGVTFLMIAYYWLVRRAFAIGRQAIKLDRVFSGLVAEGVGIWIGVQVVFNAGVATGLLPTKGLTLPLMSYGGSALLATMAAIALLLRVDRENRILMRGGRV